LTARRTTTKTAAGGRRAVRGSRTGRPIMALLDLLGRRWALRILWELHEAGALGFAEIQARSEGISPSVLSQRLRDLVDGGLVVLGDDGRYAPGRDAAQLARILLDLDAWARRWSRR
jgi:DNA-binding HxlR family transcriptional regulator